MAESVLDVVRHHCEMRIIFAGTPEVAVPSLRALAAAGHDICSVITRQDAPVGRKRVMTQSPVAEAAETLGLPVLRLPSTSPANASWTFERKLAAWREVVAQAGLL